MTISINAFSQNVKNNCDKVILPTWDAIEILLFTDKDELFPFFKDSGYEGGEILGAPGEYFYTKTECGKFAIGYKIRGIIPEVNIHIPLNKEFMKLFKDELKKKVKLPEGIIKESEELSVYQIEYQSTAKRV